MTQTPPPVDVQRLPSHPRDTNAPPLKRGHMPSVPWLGWRRGVMLALRQACRPGGRPDATATQAPWYAAASRRRGVLLALVAALAVLAFTLQWNATPSERSPLWWAQVLLCTWLFAWVGIGVATALMGAWVAWRGDRHALAPPAAGGRIDAGARTALLLPICNEDVAAVFAALEATCESLAATGALPLFDVFVLSDTSEPGSRAAELRAWRLLRERLGDGTGPAARIHYRWRRHRTKRKAGNVADFCRRWGRGYRYMVVLDADSTMHGDTLVALVKLMEANPRAGIVQTLPQTAGGVTLHARAQQFAAGVTGRLFALGMAFWQLGEAHYWGHNAILRVEPFMRHCGLARLPGRGGLAGDILSHDFVEAALMRRAGYEVWLAPSLTGSWEQHPANLVEELQRDRRWCQGNLQNLRLVAEPGLAGAHRAMLAVGALSYLVAPLWLVFVGLGSLGLAGASTAMSACTLALLVLPRALGVAVVAARGEAARHGGGARLLGSAVLELLISALLAPVRMLAHTGFVLGALTGWRLDWKSPARSAAALAWRDALARIGSLAWPALLVMLLLSGGDALRDWRAAPWLLPLLLAVPLAVLGADPRRGRAGRGLLAVPEEQAPPRVLARSTEWHAFAHLMPAAAAPVGAPDAARRRRRASTGPWLGAALAILVALLPRPALGPGRPSAWPGSIGLMTWTEAAAEIRPEAVRPRAPATLRARSMRPTRPARMIDDAVRQRAADYVARAQLEG